MSDQQPDITKELRALAGDTFGLPWTMVTLMVGDQVVIARGDAGRFEVLAQRADNMRHHDPHALASVARVISIEANRQRTSKANDLAQLRRQLEKAETDLVRLDGRIERLRVLGELPPEKAPSVNTPTSTEAT